MAVHRPTNLLRVVIVLGDVPATVLLEPLRPAGIVAGLALRIKMEVQSSSRKGTGVRARPKCYPPSIPHSSRSAPSESAEAWTHPRITPAPAHAPSHIHRPQSEPGRVPTCILVTTWIISSAAAGRHPVSSSQYDRSRLPSDESCGTFLKHCLSERLCRIEF